MRCCDTSMPCSNVVYHINAEVAAHERNRLHTWTGQCRARIHPCCYHTAQDIAEVRDVEMHRPSGRDARLPLQGACRAQPRSQRSEIMIFADLISRTPHPSRFEAWRLPCQPANCAADCRRCG